MLINGLNKARFEVRLLCFRNNQWFRVDCSSLTAKEASRYLPVRRRELSKQCSNVDFLLVGAQDRRNQTSWRWVGHLGLLSTCVLRVHSQISRPSFDSRMDENRSGEIITR